MSVFLIALVLVVIATARGVLGADQSESFVMTVFKLALLVTILGWLYRYFVLHH